MTTPVVLSFAAWRFAPSLAGWKNASKAFFGGPFVPAAGHATSVQPLSRGSCCQSPRSPSPVALVEVVINLSADIIGLVDRTKVEANPIARCEHNEFEGCD